MTETPWGFVPLIALGWTAAAALITAAVITIGRLARTTGDPT